MTDRIRVGVTAEFGADGDRKLIDVDGTSIGVLRFGGELYAIENNCAHQAGPVCEGKVQETLVAEFTGPGEHVNESFVELPAISCPFHGWEYDLRTGEHLGDREIVLDTYPVTVEDDTVYIEV